jgi:two-component system catabolic regulation response regulator CreB
MASSVILVVEDEPAIADTICTALRLDGFTAVSVGTAAAALSRLADDVSLAIVDIGLPDRSGFDLLREIRKVSSVPVMLLTARSEEIDRVLGLELGADDYVVKPFSPRELVARVRAILRRISTTPSTPTGESGSTSVDSHANHQKIIGPFQIDRGRKVIHYAGQRLHLSAYEYGTLELFLDHPGRVFSREQIMDHVWADPEESFDRAVDTVIKNIRAAIRSAQADTTLDPIETRRGMGYCLREEIARFERERKEGSR